MCHILTNDENSKYNGQGEVRPASLKFLLFYRENNNKNKIKRKRLNGHIYENSFSKETKTLLVHCLYQAFAREGAKVIATDINESKLQELEKYPGEPLSNFNLASRVHRVFKALILRCRRKFLSSSAPLTFLQPDTLISNIYSMNVQTKISIVLYKQNFKMYAYHFLFI